MKTVSRHNLWPSTWMGNLTTDDLAGRSWAVEIARVTKEVNASMATHCLVQKIRRRLWIGGKPSAKAADFARTQCLNAPPLKSRRSTGREPVAVKFNMNSKELLPREGGGMRCWCRCSSTGSWTRKSVSGAPHCARGQYRSARRNRRLCDRCARVSNRTRYCGIDRQPATQAANDGRGYRAELKRPRPARFQAALLCELYSHTDAAQPWCPSRDLTAEIFRCIGASHTLVPGHLWVRAQRPGARHDTTGDARGHDLVGCDALL